MLRKICLALATLAAVRATALAEPTTFVTRHDGETTTVYDALNAPVFTTGAVIFAATYGASAFAGATDGSTNLLIPIVGPWRAFDQRPACDPTARSCDHETTIKIMLVGDGILQVAGLLGMLDGILEPSSHKVRHRLAQDTSIHPRPMMIGDANDAPGFGVSGRF